jgi:transcription initiation factor TFIID TATA-box-binding protein
VTHSKIIVSKYKQTFVASSKLNRKADLEKALTTLNNAMFEPEQFPALIYCMKASKVEIYLFESGKVVCTGTKKDDLHSAIVKLEADLYKPVQ